MKKLKYFILGMCIFLLMGTTLRPTQVGYKGDIKGIVCGYSDADTVTISAGYCDCNGTLYTQAAATTHDITSGVAGQFVYIFLDDSASSPSTPVYRSEDSGVETPAYSAAKQGWYSDQTVADRAVGRVHCSGAATMYQFITYKMSDTHIRTQRISVLLGTEQNPTGAWIAPDDFESSVKLSVMAIEACMYTQSIDIHGAVFYVTSYEASQVIANFYNFPLSSTSTNGTASIIDWIPLGASRNIRYGAADDDDDGSNYLTLMAEGYSR